ncbi:MAG: CoA-binding protein [Deltaproteobacteria bacterium]|nr:CoA-binding protein [Deltaproteobacteria bacterium]
MPDGLLFTSILEPQAIAFIGASTNPAKWGFNILHNIVRGGYAGNLYPVNARGGTWFGRPLYKSLAEVPRPLDLPGENNIVRRLDGMGLMAYDSPERAIRALAKAQDYYRIRRARASGAPTRPPAGV